ncbi:MAG: protein-disulfide reductase DsbD family protein, partial [Pseudomonadales bacterium]
HIIVLLAALAAPPLLAQFDTSPQNAASALFEGNEDEFLPVEQAYQLTVHKQDEQILLSWVIADGYYLYRNRFAAELQGSGAELELPKGKTKQDEYFGEVQVFYHAVDGRLALPQQAAGSLQLKVTSQGCADAGLCYPPRHQYYTVDVQSGVVTAAAPMKEQPGAKGNTTPDSNRALNIANAGDQVADQSLLLMVLFAFVGGLVLNLMPCVFPVLALKVMGLVQANHDSPAQRRLHGFSYTAGVLVCFLLVASVLLALRSAGAQFGWGFQLQAPWFVAVLVYLFFTLGLSLSGMLNIGSSWAGAGQRLTEHSGARGSFFTGMLAVVVASPCTAPFMGAALGFALLQPSFIALIIFLALGLGMAAPFLLLVLVPQLAGLLPRPGEWMNTLKEILAFPLYATAVWLLWVIGRQTGANGMAAVVAGCVLIGFAVWLLRPGRNTWGKWLAAATTITALAILPSSLLAQKQATRSTVAAYNAERITELRSAGKAVFVNVTADWCITCLANERVALSTDKVMGAFRDNNIAYLKGDWTNSDPKISALLSAYGRSGVPLYLLFPADRNREAIVLPQLLTPTLVLDALKQI